MPSEFVMSLDKLIADECELIETVATSDSLSMPEYRLAFIECKEQVDKALCSLDVKEKDVLYAWYEGMSYEEGCARLHMSRKTYDGKLQKVKKTIRRACAINKTLQRV